MSIPPSVTRPHAPAPSRAPVGAVGAAIGGCLFVVVLLGLGVRTAFGPELRLDTALSGVFYAGDARSRALDILLQIVTSPGSSIARVVVVVPVLVLLARRRAWLAATWVLVAVAVIGPLNSLLKHLVGRLRPQFANGGAHLQSLSYPSGHSSGIATTVVVGLVLFWPVLSVPARRIWLAVGVLLVAVVGASRMWLGVHYLSDVLAGWSLGIAWALLTALLFGAFAGGRAALPTRR